jgi:universal stress protein E
MSNYRKLFLIANPELRRTSAMDQAAALARQSGATLQMCLFDHSAAINAISHFDPAGGAAAREGWLERRRRWLFAEAESLRGHGVPTTADVSWAHPLLEEMLAQIAEVKPDLVIKDLREEPLLKRALLTPLDWQLLRLCPAPLLLVHHAAGGALPKRIVAAIDPSRTDAGSADFNETIIRAALSVSLQTGAELHLLHALAPMNAIAVATPAGESFFSAELYDAFVAGQRQLFDRYADAHGVPKERQHFVIGPPAIAVTEHAQRIGADLLVIGSIHRHGLDRLLVGSTAEQILDRLPCSLLAIKPATT